jgi:putative lipoprotein
VSEPEEPRIVEGEIVLPDADLPGEAAELVVQVEDVSRADAPSRVVGEQRLRDVHLARGGRLPFQVEVPADSVDPGLSYSLRAHVDVSGSGEVEPGDLLTTQSYPVLTPEQADSETVAVQRI